MACPSPAVADRLGLPATGAALVVLCGRTLREAMLAWDVAMVGRGGTILHLAPDAAFVTVRRAPEPALTWERLPNFGWF
ncbi:hypothetical protein ACQP2K_29680 [Microbispora siamensis]